MGSNTGAQGWPDEVIAAGKLNGKLPAGFDFSNVYIVGFVFLFIIVILQHWTEKTLVAFIPHVYFRFTAQHMTSCHMGLSLMPTAAEFSLFEPSKGFRSWIEAVAPGSEQTP